ncbi:hypothetical protein V2J09_012088, partial [Rumex salicifolius]
YANHQKATTRKSGTGKFKPYSFLLNSGPCLYDLLCAADCQASGSKSRRDKSDIQMKLELMLSQAVNKYCADCGSLDPKWVLSVNLDAWTEQQVEALSEMGGNTEVNKKFEACVPGNVKKPKPDSSTDERADFIRRKYELKQFHYADIKDEMSCPYPRIVCTSPTAHRRSCSQPLEKRQVHKQGNSLHIPGIGHVFRNSWKKNKDCKALKKSHISPGMIEFVGLINVKILRGTNLAIRDVVTSDPYVILSLGHQTRVVKSNLNPVWNEKLMLSIPDHVPPLKLLVYDKDTFSTDDFMGDAEIDIQPLVTAAKAYERTTLENSSELGIWMASRDNTLVKDSTINLIDGKVKQEMSIKLQNVERGILDLELECVPLTQ